MSGVLVLNFAYGGSSDTVYRMPSLAKWTKNQLLAVSGKTIPDVIAPDLRVLFCGINPGLYSGMSGHHFARPGNRFWPALLAAGFTDRLLQPEEDVMLIQYGCGITNLVERATAAADELSAEEFRLGGARLAEKVVFFKPRTVAILGVSAYRTAFQIPKASIGRQKERVGSAELWVLPNPSGLNAHYTPSQLAEVFRAFRVAIGIK